MGHIIQRFGIEVSRGWLVLLLVVAVLSGAALWVGPLRRLPAEVQVLAVSGGEVARSVVAQQERDTTTGRVRFGFKLAMRNVGARATRPQRLLLSVPAHYQLATRDGPLVGEITPGVPLRRYAVDVPSEPLAADSAVHEVSSEPLWLEPDISTYYCAAPTGPIPEFLPAPPRNAELMSDVRIYYSVKTALASERHGGLLDVRVDPAALQVTPAPMPPVFPTTFRETEIDAPQLTGLRFAGARSSHCGDAEQPIELYTTVWQTPEGGRMYVLHVQGAPRKHLYDLDRDSVIELETWDVDGDGRFDSRRPARFVVPEFLVPFPPQPVQNVALDALMPYDEWLVLFGDASLGPRRFTQAIDAIARADSTAAALAAATAAAAAAQAAITDSAAVVRDTIRPATEELTPDVVPTVSARSRVLPRDTAGVTRPTRAWLTLFRNTGAGPFRFTRQAAVDSAALVAAQDSARAARRPRRTTPLGVPVPYPRRDSF